MHYFCITHRPIPWRVPDYMTIVGTGDHVPERGIALSRSHPDLAHINDVWSEYGALFAIRRILEQDPGGDMVGLAHWRRFPVIKTVGPIVGLNQHFTGPQFETLSPDLFIGDGATVIAPSPVDLTEPVLTQFGRTQVEIDLRRLMRVAVDLDVVDEETAAKSLSGAALVPAPSASVVPVAWFVEMVDALERVGRRFESDLYRPRPGYQSRVIGFTLERLHSLLLLQRLIGEKEREIITQPTVLVQEVQVVNRLTVLVAPDGDTPTL